MAKFAKAVVEITTEDKTSKDLNKIKGNLATVQRAATKPLRVRATGIDKAALAVTGLASAFNLLRGAIRPLQDVIKNLDSLGKTADRLGTTTESLASLQLAADLAGVSTANLNKSMQRLAVGIGESVVKGTGTANDAFKKLGLSAEELSKLPLDQQFAKVSDAIAGYGTTAEKASLLNDIFGKSGVKLANLIGQGGDAIRQATLDAEAFGTAISRDAVAGVEKANDSLTRVKEVIKGAFTQAVIRLAPLIESIGTAIADWARESRSVDIVVFAIEKLIAGFKFLGVGVTIAQAQFTSFVSRTINGAKLVVDAINFLSEKVSGIRFDTSGIDALAESFEQTANRLRAKVKTDLQDAINFEFKPAGTSLDIKPTIDSAGFERAAKAADTLDKIVAQANKQLEKFKPPQGDKFEQEARKVVDAYDKVINQLSKAIDENAEFTDIAVADEKLKQLALARTAAIAEIVGRKQAEQALKVAKANEAVADAQKSLQELTATDSATKAADNVSRAYDSVADKLRNALKDAPDQAKTAILAQIKEVETARLNARKDAIEKAKQIEANANLELAQQRFDTENAIIQLLSDQAAQRALGNVSQSRGGFDAQAVSAQATAAFRDPQITELKKSTKELEKQTQLLDKLDKKEAVFG